MDVIINEARARLADMKQDNLDGGGRKNIERQNSLGKLYVRERIDILFDKGTFHELGSLVRSSGVRIDGKTAHSPADGAIIGTGKIDGRPVAVYASDFTVLAGSMGAQHSQKFFSITGWAAKWGIPIVWLLDSAGGRLGEYDIPTAGLEWFFWYESRFSGVVPQIHLLLGPCVAGQAYAPCLCDFLIMARGTSNLWLGGPRLTSAATSESMDVEVGSADYHMRLSGTTDYVGSDDYDAIKTARRLISYLPQNYKERPPQIKCPYDDPFRKTFELCDIVNGDLTKNYNMHEVIKVIVDNGDYLELKDQYAKNLITCFARINGRPVGIVANNPNEPGSILEVNSCDKYYRFLSILDAYDIPLINLVDTNPFVPGEDEEEKGLLRHGGKIIDVYANARNQKITVILRQAYGDCGAILMGVSKGMGADLCYAWPNVIMAVEASTENINEIYENAFVNDDTYETYLKIPKQKLSVFDVAKTWSSNVIDEVIDPSETRIKLIEALDATCEKQENLPMFPESKKRHGAPPV